MELRTIDSFGFSNVSLMKIDVEGFELKVLRGAEQTIRRWQPALVIEIAGYDRYDALPTQGKQQVDRINVFMGQIDYEIEFVEKGGEPNFLALPRGR